MSFAYSSRTVNLGRRRRGFTLVEMLTAFTLLLLLFTMMFKFLIPAMKKSSSTSIKTERQQRATLSLRKMVAEMERTTTAGISVLDSPPTVAIHPITDVTQNSRRVYEDHVVIYQYDAANKQILRGEWQKGALPSTLVPKRLNQADLAAATSSLKGPALAVAKDVTNLEFLHQGTGGYLKLPLQVKMELEQKENDGTSRFELVRNVSLRNQL